MERRLRFYKDEEGDWYADIPEWEGEVEELQMVLGADIMLDILSQFEDSIWLTMNTERPDTDDIKAILRREILEGIPSGSMYNVQAKHISTELPIWLCDVTKFVFGNFPETIYLY